MTTQRAQQLGIIATQQWERTYMKTNFHLTCGCLLAKSLVNSLTVLRYSAHTNAREKNAPNSEKLFMLLSLPQKEILETWCSNRKDFVQKCNSKPTPKRSRMYSSAVICSKSFFLLFLKKIRSNCAKNTPESNFYTYRINSLGFVRWRSSGRI